MKASKQSEIVWAYCDNAEGGAGGTHAYYAVKKRWPWIGDEYDGIGALCNKKRFISEDGETSIGINEVDALKAIPKYACKTCLKIFNKLNP
jgi:hypothetical protein